MDINFSKGKVTSDFKEAEELENIKSGESIGTIFGKVQRWFNNLKGTPKRYYGSNGELRGVDLTPDSENVPSGEYTVTSGCENIASGFASVAIGYDNTASDGYAFTMGLHNIASGYSSFAIGQGSKASAIHSNAIGWECTADKAYSTVIGCRNSISEKSYAFIVGNGSRYFTDTIHRSNALTLDWDGNLWTAGDVTATDSEGNQVSLCELKSDFEGLSAITEAEIDKILKAEGLK